MHVLFLTTNKEFLEENGRERLFLGGLIEAAEVLNIIVLSDKQSAHTIQKINDHTWIYPTNSSFRWLQCIDAIRLARFHLLWHGEFRTHIVYSDDPYAAGWAGRFLAYWYERVWIVNVRDYSWGTRSIKRHPLARLSVVPLRYLFSHAYRVCVFSEITRLRLITTLKKEYTQKISMFPRIYDSEMIGKEPVGVNIKEKYPEFNFVLLVISTLDSSNRISLAFDILVLLRQHYPKAGLVILGNGNYVLPLKFRAKTLGIGDWVRFEDTQDNLISYAKTTNILLHISSGEENEDAFIKAAAARCPIIALKNTLSEAVIEDGKNGFLIPEASPALFVRKIIELNESPGVREQFRANSDMNFDQDLTKKDKKISEMLKQLWQYEEAPQSPESMPTLHLHVLEKESTDDQGSYKETLKEMFPSIFSPKNK